MQGPLSLQIFRMCYNAGMKLYRVPGVLQTLREKLEAPERAERAFDLIEGRQPQARKAAVLLPLFEQDGTLSVVFIKRALSLRSHRGEIAFPGGGVEPEDTSPVMTALRESREEIGLDPARVQVLGVLAPVFTVASNYVITPVVAFLPQGLGTVQLQVSEVAELIVVPLAALADPKIMHTEQWSRDGRSRTIYFYDYGSRRIWGATGRIVHAFLSLLATDTVYSD
jgi:8-oxo-dGTP pyrophosphatase MutT (NUDIX family)